MSKMIPQPDKPSADEQPRWEMREDYAGSANYMRYWFESPMESLDLHEVPAHLNTLTDALAAANTAREEAERRLAQYKEALQAAIEVGGEQLVALATSEARAAALEPYKALALEGRRIAGKTWSTGVNFNGPPSPREWRAWMAQVDALATQQPTGSPSATGETEGAS